MIRQLQKRFILAAVLSLLAVLTVIVGAVNVSNYLSFVREADSTLETLRLGDGSFGPRPDAEGGRTDPASRIPKELPFRTRYFSVTVSSSGQILSSDLEHVAAVTEEEAAQLAKEAALSGHGKGFLNGYRYTALERERGTKLIFLDCSSELSSFRTNLRSSVLISLGGLAAVFVLLLILSRRIVRPFTENYEKQKRFITNAGHELKTPLAIINADTEVLEMDGENEFLTDIRKQTAKMARLTGDLVTLARMEETDSPRVMQVFSLSSLAEEAAESARTLAVSRQKTFTAEIAPDLEMEGDEQAVSSVLGILLDNAFKYSPENGAVAVTLERKGKQAVLTVENDSTEPVTKENCARMFERFYRSDAARGSGREGFGLGLAIAETAVTAHKGKIAAEPRKEGQALAVTVRLPLG